MARHLIIGDGTSLSASLTGGLVDDGAISVQKMTESGPTELALGDSFADAPQIRIVGGGKDGKNIVTPWIYGRDVINWGGNSYTASAAGTATDTIAGVAAAVGTIEYKFVRLGGPRPEFFSCTLNTTAVAAAAQDAVIKTAFEALTNIPDWLNPICDASAGSTCVFSGAKRGDVAQSGDTWDYDNVNIDLIVVEFTGGTQTHTASNAGGTPGYGDGFHVRKLEEDTQGTSHGFYMRGHLPKQPSLESVTGTNYDMYNITATKDGSSNSQIHGVDNLIEINVAAVAGDADSLIVENKLNAYFTGHFPAVIL